MNSPLRNRLALIGAVILLCILPAAQAVSDSDYSTTYIITVGDDGSAKWLIEYRTPLLTDDDLTSFENYSQNMNTVYLPELRDLMQRSAAQAALGTARDMAVNDFTGNAVVQTSPTGKYGVITYTFSWTNFAGTDNGISIGDAFVGGMYLARGNTLIIKYPQGYTPVSVNPSPDQDNDGLTWYGLRSLGPGQPSVTLTGTTFSILPVLGGGFLIVIIILGGVMLFRRKGMARIPDERGMEESMDAEESLVTLSKADLETLEEKIMQLLTAQNGEMFQSEIVKVLGLPKSTVSTTLNDLHQRGIIQKVRKGRENLIRLVRDQG
jgi:uncharacterized membrane protein